VDIAASAVKEKRVSTSAPEEGDELFGTMKRQFQKNIPIARREMPLAYEQVLTKKGEDGKPLQRGTKKGKTEKPKTPKVINPPAPSLRNTPL
jgi:hypothetical protein